MDFAEKGASSESVEQRPDSALKPETVARRTRRRKQREHEQANKEKKEKAAAAEAERIANAETQEEEPVPVGMSTPDGGIITRYSHEERSVTRQAGGLARLPHTPHGLGYTWASRLIQTRPRRRPGQEADPVPEADPVSG